MSADNIVMFGPKNGKDLKRQYPELSEIKEFTNLSQGELLFSWYYANPTSPLVTDSNMSDKLRASNAFNISFPSSVKDVTKEEYMSLNFPDRVRQAIDRWRKFNPTVRQRAKSIVEKALDNMEKMVDMEMSDFVEKDDEGNKTINWTGRNSYVNSIAKISDTLPQLIAQVESGFGIVNTKGETTSASKAIDRFHETKKDS